MGSEAELETSRRDACCQPSAVGTCPSPSEGLTGKASSSISPFPALPRSRPVAVLTRSTALIGGRVATAGEGRFPQSPRVFCLKQPSHQSRGFPGVNTGS